MPPASLPDQVRAACGWVMGRARFVQIEEGAVAVYAAGLEPAPTTPGWGQSRVGLPETPVDPEAAAGFAICMNAINFGSGWWPTIPKRPGHSGYATMAAGVRVDGVLRLDPQLLGAIEAGELLEHGSPPEVELRAAAVHTVELLAAASSGALSPAEIDSALWNRGAGRRYKSLPRLRSRNTAY